MTAEAALMPIGSNGLRVLPFGNGAERMLCNKQVGAHLHGIDLNLHTPAHIYRAAQEGIACAFRYGLDIMRENGMNPTVIRASKTNMFLSDVFTQAFVNTTGVPVELYHNDGSMGAALGAGIGAEIFASATEAFSNNKAVAYVEPTNTAGYNAVYEDWKTVLNQHLSYQ